ncbi:MAG TPA: dUTP diphosphatase [Cellvibrionaceae bacterium]
MLDLQDKMNSKVHPDWRNQQYAWYRAIWVECAELMDHYGWKWWKKQTPDTEQVELELIDIWHFGLSLLLERGTDPVLIAKQVASQVDATSGTGDFREDLEAFAAATLGDKRFHVSLFARLLDGVDMSFDDLYRGYVGKNVLNFFRQDNGYQDGSYRKQWFDGREDNEHLAELAKTLDASGKHYKDELYQALSTLYQRRA